MTDYDYRNCKSLFGYAAKVHERSGGVCQLCGAGAAGLDLFVPQKKARTGEVGEEPQALLRRIRRQ